VSPGKDRDKGSKERRRVRVRATKGDVRRLGGSDRRNPSSGRLREREREEERRGEEAS
jgi:hypothetical protein